MDRPLTAERLDAALLLLVVRTHDQGRRAPTWAEMHAATGLSARQPIHRHLLKLRAAGLVAWEDGLHGTLRPLVAEHPIYPTHQTES